MIRAATYCLALALTVAGLAAPASAQQGDARCDEDVQFELGPEGRLRRAKEPERIILEGGARIFRCDEEITAPRIIAYLQDGETLVRADVPEGARLVRGNQTAEAGWAVIDFEEGLGTLGGGVRIASPGASVSCQRVEADIDRLEIFCQGIDRPLTASLNPGDGNAD